MVKAVIVSAVFTIALPVFAQSGAKPSTNPSVPDKESMEARQKMAEAHEKFAACLRTSDKTTKDCHDEMHANCQSMGHACPMMGMHPQGGPGGHAHGKGWKKGKSEKQ